ncbi:deoxyribose-phosphate aldolase [Metabacillus idriensis]|uniref:deoxyribose-phosphate aldolase n=1 Tax=Metabacillus idriensis TaxID=324768 RepID=UPI00174AE5D9|nr:deoxyribose-phosphate aldolase [Metabacillus idriensis]
MNTAKMIDHTLLKAEATKEQIVKLCEEAREYGFASVCVNPVWVNTAAEELKGSDVKVCTVIGFPLGASTAAVKAAETADAIQNGAGEVDMVLSIGLLKSGSEEAVEADIRAVVEAAESKAIVKVIIETSLLTEEEKVRACELSLSAGADFVKTSTGFSTGGATVEDVTLMRKVVGDKAGVKASGGIRDLNDLRAMAEAGANRIGASSGVKIMNGEAVEGGY